MDSYSGSSVVGYSTQFISDLFYNTCNAYFIDIGILDDACVSTDICNMYTIHVQYMNCMLFPS